jgi:hypothetical protein
MNQTWTLVGPDREPYASDASWKAQRGSVSGASAIQSGARIMLAAGLGIVGKQTASLVLAEGDHIRACASSPAVIDWR